MKKIKKILTAIGNPILNYELKNLKEFNVIENDIQYQDGILEVLEICNNIDFIILNQLLPGENELNDLIEKIQIINSKIKIIIILEKYDESMENILIKQGIYRIIYNNQININDIAKIIEEDEKLEKYNQEIKRDINELKENMKIEKQEFQDCENNKKILNIINNNKIEKNYLINYFIKIKNKIIIIKEKIYFIINKIFKINNKKINYEKNNMINKKIINKIKCEKNIKLINNINNIKKINNNPENINNIINKKNKVISVLGNNGSGKSLICVRLANIYKQKNDKILIIDFDVLNNSLHTILGVKKYPEKIKEILNNKLIKNINQENNINKINIDDLIININKKIDLISGINLIFNPINKVTENELNNIIKKLSKKYDVIIIDTSSECFFKYTKEIMKISDECIFVTEANLIEISKSKRLLEIYENNWNIENNKIKIIFNKVNKSSINKNILKKLYFDYEIIGDIKLKNNYKSIINKRKMSII